MESIEPRNETEWEELLSAYLDGELEAGERRAVEAWLALHTERAARLDELARLGDLLHVWTVEAPEPDAAFLRRLEGLAAGAGAPREVSWREALRRIFWPAWAAGAALFLAGVLAGAGGFMVIRDRLAAPVKTTTAVAAAPVASDSGPGITAIQAASLSRELQAGDLRDRLMRDLQRRDYDSAARRYQDLWDNYRDSAALRQLKQNPALRAAAEHFEDSGRI